MCLAALVSACAPPGESETLLLLDTDARAAELTLSLGGWSGSPTLPISVREHDSVVLAGGFGTRKLELRPGHLGLVVGSAGSIAWRRLEELDGDALELEGDERAVSTVATELGAALKENPSRSWRLSGPDVLARSAWMLAATGIERARPVPLSTAVPLDGFVASPSTQRSVVLVNEVLSVVGLYVSDGQALLLDASGGFTLDFSGCERTTGSFRFEGGDVVLMPSSGPPRRLRVNGDALEADTKFTLMTEAP